MTTSRPLSMSSATGKQILSLIRSGDYAHAGEEEAIRLTLSGIASDHQRRVLDIGCGLGGTADYIARLGFGTVTGIDIDPETISYAQTRYPKHTFVCGSAVEASRYVHPGFSLSVIFNALYTFPDQDAALREAWKVTVPKGELRVFDYTATSATPTVRAFCDRYGKGRWAPIILDEAQQRFADAGWRIESVTDLTTEYERWYADLVKKIHDKKDDIIARGGEHWFAYALQRYQELLDAIRDGIVGGAILQAIRV